MAMTRRGKSFLAIGGAIVLIAGVLVIMSAFGKTPNIKIPGILNGDPGDAPQPTCPLTGAPGPNDGKVPDRPALAIKVENAPEARPQYGLATADIIYEQPVEGGITRFIVIYQCDDAKRVESVRSARTSDPDILIQFGSPLFAYADAAAYVEKSVEKHKQIQDVNWKKLESAYHVDPNREIPHQLYTSTRELYDGAPDPRGFEAPDPVFQYSEEFPDVKSRKGRKVELVFSSTYADVIWTFQDGAYVRSHGQEDHVLSDGSRVTTDNVLVQEVEVDATGHKDPAGNPVPEVISIGSGRAWLFRDGKQIQGTWERKGPGDITSFTAKDGTEFLLKPGTTWVELYPESAPKPKG